MATTIRDNSYTAKPQLAAYRYDQLNRIKQMQTYQSITGNAWGSTSTNAYKEAYAYDANGNIKTLERYDGAATPVKIDNLTYGYNKDANGKLINNRLNYIADPVVPSTCNYDIDGQSPGNYGYDEIGNLIRDNAEGIASIEWNAYGKIKSITRAPGIQKSNLEFIYDAMGNRVCKIEKPYNVTSTGWLYTFYVRDASGNIMSTYTKTGDQIEDAVITLDEVMLYGSSRLGVRMVNKTIAQLEAETSLYLFNRRLGLKRYEMSNHLGNVLTTFTDRKQQVQSSGMVTGYKTYITSSQDYYPFGMGMNERSWNPESYGFGFGSHEKIDEVYGSGNVADMGDRWLDTRIGRTPKPDKLAYKFSSESPYIYAGNNPIFLIDKNGEYKYPADKERQYREKYPLITKYLEFQIEKDVSNSAKIIAGFKSANPNISEKTILNKVKWNQGYTITFEDAPGEWPVQYKEAAGYTVPDGEIQMNAAYATYVEKFLKSDASEEEKLTVFSRFYMTLIHETAHKNHDLGKRYESNGKEYYERHNGDYTYEDGAKVEESIWGYGDYKPFSDYGKDYSGKGKSVVGISSPTYYPGVTEEIIEEAKKTPEGKKTLPTVPQ